MISHIVTNVAHKVIKLATSHTLHIHPFVRIRPKYTLGSIVNKELVIKGNDRDL